MSEPHVPFEVEVLPVREASTMLIEVHADNDAKGDAGAHEGQVRARKIDPTQMCLPSNKRRYRLGLQTLLQAQYRKPATIRVLSARSFPIDHAVVIAKDFSNETTPVPVSLPCQ